MKIALISNSESTLSNFRGELIKDLSLNNELYFLIPFDDGQESILHSYGTIVNVPFERRSKSFFENGRLTKQYVTLFKEIQPDLVIAYTIKPNIFGSKAAKKMGIKHAINITGLGAAFESPLLCWYVKRLYKSALTNVEKVFFQNEENRDVFLNSKLIDPNKAVMTSGSGVNLEKFQYLDYPQNEVINFLFIGRVMKAKGVEELLLASKQLHDKGYKFKVTLIGMLENGYEKIFDGYNELEYISYEGRQGDVISYIKSSDCIVLPSYFEGISNALLEGASIGRPLIATDIAGCRETIVDGVSGFLVKKKDSHDLCEKMEKFCKLSCDEKAKMGVASRSHIEKNFDRKEVIKKIKNELGLS